MNVNDFGRFAEPLRGEVLVFNPDALPEPDALHIRMTRGERRIADELREQLGGFERVIIDVDGEQHEFSADSFIRLLEDYEGAQGMNNHIRLFGTPERAARTIADLQTCSLGFDIECDECAVCSLCQSGARNDWYALLEWLKGGSDGE